ncbi:MAG: WYL domain-containing protein [Bacteroidetes bacterium]|uniref:WYL domain-containing protein n=1 Tax=Candidatus Caccoplasma merdipullorum TaxID=2840718 RepID=A0A9D9H663_9BACT|nr:WYL domain-containing protein [Candidatus Caccoplasma merdipullorum]
MAQNLFLRYVWLVSLLYRYKRMTLREINERWLHTDYSGGVPIPRRTFHCHREKIQELFDINIECDRRTSEYYIEDCQTLANDKIRSWLLETFSVNNLAAEQQHLHDRILLEKIPSGEIYLTSVIEAMRDSRIIKFTYKSFTDAAPHDVYLQPYFVKVFRQRWYVIGYTSAYNGIRTYSIDRFENIEVTKESFEYPSDFIPEEYFDGCFGIMYSNLPCESVVLKVSSVQAGYFKTLPLHETQKTVSDTETHTVFKYEMKITNDLIKEILSYGADVEVISPQSLRSKIEKHLSAALQKYKKHNT